MNIPVVSVKDLHNRLGYVSPLEYPATSLNKPLTEWLMEEDDAAIFRYLYRNFKPQRHLEFGTWQGTGSLYCLEECNATVWTMNLLDGEKLPGGRRAYPSIFLGRPSLLFRAKRKVKSWISPINQDENKFRRSSDAIGFIGRYYLEAGFGHRVCQIYCNSMDWDITHYPADFFDTALIDGGHYKNVVVNDTKKACQLLRPGGLLMWHDFCPVPEVQSKCAWIKEVANAIESQWDWLNEQLDDIFWISPSWILLGVKR